MIVELKPRWMVAIMCPLQFSMLEGCGRPFKATFRKFLFSHFILFVNNNGQQSEKAKSVHTECCKVALVEISHEISVLYSAKIDLFTFFFRYG